MQELEETFETFRARLPSRARLYVAGCAGAPLALAGLFERRPDLAEGLTFLGVWIPGVNRTDWTAFHETCRAETIFLSPELRQSFEEGRTRFRPLSYTQAVKWLSSTHIDGAIAVTTPQNAAGALSLGISPDFTGTVLARGNIPAIALVSQHMPRPERSVEIDRSRFSSLCVSKAPLQTVQEPDLPPAFQTLAENIAELVEDGSTLQFGLGNVQTAVLRALQKHRDLRIHSGMVSDPVLHLLSSGALSEERDALTIGVALGSTELYTRLAELPHARFEPVSYTHAPQTLAKIERFTAINSAIEVDLFGQANAEFIRGKQVSGTGGLPDFIRGASAAPGGKSILALTSTARQGTITRIVPRLSPDATSIPRGDTDMVATEHGIAQLRHCDIDEKAEKLIAIADPQFRGHLSAEWEKMRRSM